MGRPSPSTLFALLLALMGGPFAAEGQLSVAADIVKFCETLAALCANIDSYSIMRRSLFSLTFGFFPNNY
jgi:hypothetical protein